MNTDTVTEDNLPKILTAQKANRRILERRRPEVLRAPVLASEQITDGKRPGLTQKEYQELKTKAEDLLEDALIVLLADDIMNTHIKLNRQGE